MDIPAERLVASRIAFTPDNDIYHLLWRPREKNWEAGMTKLGYYTLCGQTATMDHMAIFRSDKAPINHRWPCPSCLKKKREIIREFGGASRASPVRFSSHGWLQLMQDRGLL